LPIIIELAILFQFIPFIDRKVYREDDDKEDDNALSKISSQNVAGKKNTAFVVETS